MNARFEHEGCGTLPVAGEQVVATVPSLQAACAQGSLSGRRPSECHRPADHRRPPRFQIILCPVRYPYVVTGPSWCPRAYRIHLLQQLHHSVTLSFRVQMSPGATSGCASGRIRLASPPFLYRCPRARFRLTGVSTSGASRIDSRRTPTAAAAGGMTRLAEGVIYRDKTTGERFGQGQGRYGRAAGDSAGASPQGYRGAAEVDRPPWSGQGCTRPRRDGPRWGQGSPQSNRARKRRSHHRGAGATVCPTAPRPRPRSGSVAERPRTSSTG